MQYNSRIRLIAIAVIAVVASAGMVWKVLSDRPSEKCRPVQDFLAFNTDQQKLLDSKTRPADPGAGEPARTPSDTDLKAWADGLTERADKISDPELQATARFAADAANRERAQLGLAKAQLGANPANTSPPPALAAATYAEAEFQARISDLTRACG
ncbi:MAG: hypothetical protein JST91_01840 [Actinobacteria bacterium]|nr:hypothetical protein [Actinomycetota bacterium]